MMKLQVNFPTIKRFGTPLKVNKDHNHGGLEDHFPQKTRFRLLNKQKHERRKKHGRFLIKHQWISTKKCKPPRSFQSVLV